MSLRFVRRLRNNMAQSLVLYVKSDARYGRRLAAPIPSFKLHIPFISTPRIGFRFGRNSKTLSLRADLFGVAISWKRNDKLFLRPHHNY